MPPKSPPRWIASWTGGILLVAALTLNACIVYFSTSPTPVSDATIVIVATDGHGRFVRSLHVTIIDAGGGWRAEGLTGGDGSFRCSVGAGVTRVRADVVPPAGYVLARADSWPRDLEVSRGAHMQVDVHVTSR